MDLSSEKPVSKPSLFQTQNLHRYGVAQLKKLDALITDRDYDLLHEGDGIGAAEPRGGASVGVGGMMHKVRRRTGGEVK